MPRLASSLLAAAIATLCSGYAHAHPPGDCQGYGPMWQQLTPEQRQQMWENMHRWGYGPGMGPGMGMGMGPGGGMMMGPGYGVLMTPQQYQMWWEHMHMRGPGSGWWQQLTPEQRQQMWEQMQRWRSQGGEAPAAPAGPPPEPAPAK